jgi:hypothetical protein
MPSCRRVDGWRNTSLYRWQSPSASQLRDFISGIILVKDILQAPSDNRSSFKEYLSVKALLQSLALALNQIQGQFGDIHEDLY